MPAAQQALIDRVLFDSSTVLYLASGIGRGQPEGADGGPTPAEVLVHIAGVARRQASAIEALAAGEPLNRVAGQCPASWASEATAVPADADEAANGLRLARFRLMTAIGSLPERTFAEPMEPAAAGAIIAGWVRHIAAHAFDLIDQLPQFRRDPIALNWALFLDFSAEPERAARQRRLVAEIEASIRHAEQPS